MTSLQRLVMKRLELGPCWIRSLGPAKPIADLLVTQGLARRVRPPGGACRNMIELTEAGRAALARRPRSSPPP